MSDIASLIIRVTTNGVDRASADLSGLAGAAAKAASAIGGLALAQSAFDKLISSQRNFDKLNAGLITMTGSTENAAEAFRALQQFAATTPYDLDQAVEGFTKLVALGLNPSSEALTSFGNTAAAMGKDLNQMIEAVADAATGEFERLKEFGIKASQQGDQVSFTFRGVTTTVQKNAADIQKYLINIGETDFAGAMENRMKTLDGAMSNLDDGIEALTLSIAKSGFGDMVAVQVGKAADAVQELTDMIASGQLVTEITAWTDQVNTSFKFVSDWLNTLVGDFADAGARVSPFGQDAATDIGDGFAVLPAMVAATIQEAIAEVTAFVDQMAVVGNAIKGALNPLDFSGWADTMNTELGKVEDNLTLEKEFIVANRDATIAAYDAKIKKSKEQREAYDRERKAQVDLSKYAGPTDSTPAVDKAAQKKAEAEAKALEKQKEYAQAYLKQVQQDGMDELSLIDAKEQEKIEKITQYRQNDLISQAQFEQAKDDIEIAAINERNEKVLALSNKQKQKDDELESFQNSLLEMNDIELQNIDIQQKDKEKKAKEFYDQGLINESEYQAQLAQIQKGFNKKRVSEYSDMLGTTTDNLRTALGEGNKMYKAFAIANAIMNTYQGAVAAFQSAAAIPIVGWVAAPIAAAAAVAAGLANVAKIRSAREQGGNLAAGQISTIAERGKAEVIMPAGASRVRTAEQMRQIMGENGGNSSGNDGVTIVNQTSAPIASATTERDDEGRLRVIIRETVSGDLNDSNSTIAKSRRGTRGQPGY